MDRIYAFFKENFLLISILILATFLRFYQLDFQSLWVDEIATMIEANPQLNADETYDALLEFDFQPPLFFYLLKHLFCVFGYTSFVLRFVTAIFGIGGIIAIFLLGRELANKNVGLLSALILTVNYYHIYYSQEGRTYTLLILFVTLSFYRLSIFIRHNSYKNAILFGVMSSLMLYGHTIAFFALFAEYCILTYFFFQTENEKKWRLVKQGFLATLVIAILYIPAIPLLVAASEIKSFWISAPWSGIFAWILWEFFGSSELIISVVYLCLLIFFINAFNDRSRQTDIRQTGEINLLRVSIILLPWLVCCILISLIRSHLSLPMIIPRYFLVVLPAIVILVALGFYQIQNTTIKRVLLFVFIIFSFTDLVIVRNYYHRRTKSDFRGVTNYVMGHLKPGDQIVSRIGWHFSYWFENTDPKMPVLWNSIQNYVSTVIKSPENFKHGFWFVDAQGDPMTLTPESSVYLSQHYIMDHRTDLFSALGVHYVYRTENFTRVNFADYPQISEDYSGKIELENNTILKSSAIDLNKGQYTLWVTSGSLPEIPLNTINAHISVKLNDKLIGGFFLNEQATATAEKLKFSISENTRCRLELIFDNAFREDLKVRKAVIHSVYFEKNSILNSN